MFVQFGSNTLSSDRWKRQHGIERQEWVSQDKGSTLVIRILRHESHLDSVIDDAACGTGVSAIGLLVVVRVYWIVVVPDVDCGKISMIEMTDGNLDRAYGRDVQAQYYGDPRGEARRRQASPLCPGCRRRQPLNPVQ